MNENCRMESVQELLSAVGGGGGKKKRKKHEY